MNRVLLIDQADIDKVVLFLLNAGCEQIPVVSGTSLRNKEVVITVYNSGKVLFQGKSAEHWIALVSSLFEKSHDSTEERVMSIDSKKREYILEWPRIGTDESGKGDFFGPLVTAAFLVKNKEVEDTLLRLGVKDSKKLSDEKVVDLALKINKLGPMNVVKVGPQKYNELYARMNNLNKLLGWCHSRVIENILAENPCNLVVADQFGDETTIKKALFDKGKKAQLIQMHHAERDTAVAAASIIARAEFIRSMKQLNNITGVNLPYGASDKVIRTAILLAREKGMGYLKEVAKIHFKTYKEIEAELRRQENKK